MWMNVKTPMYVPKTTGVRTFLIHIPVSVMVATNWQDQERNAKVNV